MHEALLGVVRQSLQHVQAKGLPGEHHFYVQFRTDHPQVVIADTLKKRYPYEMTIVLQYQFWDLQVRPNGFSVAVSFNNVPHTLHVPFGALISFVDPSVHFRLQFNPRFEPAAPVSLVRNKPSPEGEEEPKPENGSGNEQGPAAPSGANVVQVDFSRKK
jgi:hypothetical protein